MLKKIAAVIAVLIAVFLVVAALRPDQFRVQRTIAIQAPPEKIYPLIADLKSWREWSPYETKDPQMQRSYSGPASGVGAHYAWDGDKNVGKGSMTIAGVAEPARIDIDLHFEAPMQARNVAQFNLAPQGDGTVVTWSMSGACPFLCRIMGLIFNMDKMVGTDFETGLANLKTVAEK